MPLAHALRGAGFEVHLAAPREPGWEAIADQGVAVHFLELSRFGIRPHEELRVLATLLRLYRRLRPAIVHHLCLKPSLYGGCSARLAKVPAAISTLTGLGPLFSKRTTKMRMLSAILKRGLKLGFSHPRHQVVVQNPDDGNSLIASGVARRSQVQVIRGSGIDVVEFSPRCEPTGDVIVLMASRLLWEKGVGEFVAAARALRAQGRRTRFLLAGESDPKHPCAVPQATIEQWRDAGDIEWLGWQDDMPTLIAQSHVVCLPSYYGEGIPRVLLEAAACGRPVVTTDSPGCREIVHHRRNGLLVPVRDTTALTQAIASLLDNAPLRASMGSCGREVAVTQFAREHVIEAYVALHRSFLTGQAARSAAGI